MSVWLGTSVGSMVETLCASELPVSAEDRAQVGGGAGTLAPVRVRVVSSFGAGGRTWQFSRAAHGAHEANTVVSLARAQARSGGYLRMVPCNAPFMNMLTPQASEEFAGWTGALSEAGGVAVTDPVYTDGTSYAGTSVVLGSGAAQSPVVPLLGFTSARFGCFVRRVGFGGVSVTMEAVDATGSVVASSSPSPSLMATMMRATWLWEGIPSSAVGVRFRVSADGVAGGFLRLAWPSITLGTRLPRFHPGQCADAVWLSPLAHTPTLLTPERAITGTSYEIREVGV